MHAFVKAHQNCKGGAIGKWQNWATFVPSLQDASCTLQGLALAFFIIFRSLPSVICECFSQPQLATKGEYLPRKATPHHGKGQIDERWNVQMTMVEIRGW